jgi:predicted nucleotidyltransferase
VKASPWAWKPVPYEERCAAQKAEHDAALASFVAHCATKPDVVRAFVFGSYARDEVTPWSDLDLLVVRDGESVPPVIVDDFYREGIARGDLIGVRATDFPGRLAESAFGRSILRDAREVYARPER